MSDCRRVMTLAPEPPIHLASEQAKVDMPAFVALLGSGSQQLALCQQEIFGIMPGACVLRFKQNRPAAPSLYEEKRLEWTGIMLEEGGAATVPRYAVNRGFQNLKTRTQKPCLEMT